KKLPREGKKPEASCPANAASESGLLQNAWKVCPRTCSGEAPSKDTVRPYLGLKRLHPSPGGKLVE
ncbi:MAG TPA: hypothetical protein DEQ04_03625, partial [Thermovirga lienii]|nr:hypothetical protein [Thermovirga lienii]